jgi:hypothetical protein
VWREKWLIRECAEGEKKKCVNIFLYLICLHKLVLGTGKNSVLLLSYKINSQKLILNKYIPVEIALTYHFELEIWLGSTKKVI